MSCAIRSYNCCKESDLCPENKTCKPYNSFQKPWKRFTCESCPDGYYGNDCKQTFTSCQDYANGSLKSGMYKVVDINMTVYEVYCHFDSAGSWTLFLSYSVVNGSKNSTFKQLRHTLSQNLPVSEGAVTWGGYRLRKSRMKSIQKNSHFLMFTCDYEKYRHINQSDYLQILLKNVSDVLELHKKTSYVVRKGHGKIKDFDMSDCQIHLHQRKTTRLHVDINSTVSQCKFNLTTCSDRRHYFCSSHANSCMNKLHRCKENVNSTTQLWFGNM